MNNLSNISLPGLTITTVSTSSYWTLSSVDVNDVWSIYVDENGAEAACGNYNLGTHKDPFRALMVVLADISRRAREVKS